MKGNNEEIVGLFRQKLGRSEMPVNDGFWEALERDLPASGVAESKRRILSPSFYRIAAAASVVLVLGMASAAFWFFSPKEEMEEAFTQVAALVPGASLDGDRLEEILPSVKETTPTTPSAGQIQPVLAASGAEEEGEQTMSVRVSIRVTQQVYGHAGRNKSGSYHAGMGGNGYHAASSAEDMPAKESTSSPQVEEKSVAKSVLKSRNWALKAYVGSSLPDGDFRMPLTTGVSVERQLGKRLSLEAGLQYNRLHDVALPEGSHTYHTLSIPVRLNVNLAGNDKVDLYAMAGGSVEKCVAGAENNSFGAEPLQQAVLAGVGVRYKLNDRFALFAEPMLTYHFDTDSSTRTLRTERPANFNLLCGVRMTY